MLQRIKIRSFGPVEVAELDVTDVIILNGVQSSGKSTIAKSIYFFKSLPETLYQYLISKEDPEQDLTKELVIACRKRLMEFFGTTKHLDGFFLEYQYAPEIHITIQYETRSGHARVNFSNKLFKGLRDAAKKIQQYRAGARLDKPRDFSSLQAIRAEQMRFYQSIRRELKLLFHESRDMLYIPAGRSLVTTLSEELREIESFQFDPLMKEFVSRICLLRGDFTQELEAIIEDRKKLTAMPIDFQRVDAVKVLIAQILKGRYRVENGEERILLDDGNYIKIRFSSSGQQEALWILHLIFLAVLEGQPTFSVLEEPEAHLYPMTQYQVIKLIALFLGAEKNQAIITTHSPYVMAAINTLLVAHQAGIKNPQQAARIVDRRAWLDGNNLSAYFVGNGRIYNIYDHNTGIIDPQFIDRASEKINNDFDQLLEIVQP
ncbi:ATP-binding protein [Desulfurispirillum indicum]|uniref:AAA family ATPase n=1 Tax=Desulfurispirillum indicum TaxID=936456 RepID=UPI001CFADDBF|nr:AAA family ATPase [Desulfurispirillum indicum]UCZ56531.1 ATP-binding protein [Desulfurispirillum indicum]